MAVETSRLLLPHLHKADGNERTRFWQTINKIPFGPSIGGAFVEGIDYNKQYTGDQPNAEFPHQILVANVQPMGISIEPMSLKLSINPQYGYKTPESESSLRLQVILGSIDQLAAHDGSASLETVLDVYSRPRDPEYDRYLRFVGQNDTNKLVSVIFPRGNIVVGPNSLWLAKFSANLMESVLNETSG
jgi:hypothetical protein